MGSPYFAADTMADETPGRVTELRMEAVSRERADVAYADAVRIDGLETERDELRARLDEAMACAREVLRAHASGSPMALAHGLALADLVLGDSEPVCVVATCGQPTSEHGRKCSACRDEAGE